MPAPSVILIMLVEGSHAVTSTGTAAPSLRAANSQMGCGGLL